MGFSQQDLRIIIDLQYELRLQELLEHSEKLQFREDLEWHLFILQQARSVRHQLLGEERRIHVSFSPSAISEEDGGVHRRGLGVTFPGDSVLEGFSPRDSIGHAKSTAIVAVLHEEGVLSAAIDLRAAESQPWTNRGEGGREPRTSQLPRLEDDYGGDAETEAH